MKKFYLMLIALTLLLINCIPTFAASNRFTKIYFFGDSLSDMGNYQVGTFPGDLTKPQPAPITNWLKGTGHYAHTTWAQYFAKKFGLNATPSNSKGNDYAIAGATTLQTFLDEASTFNQPITDPNKTLFAIWVGANDIQNQIPPTQSIGNLVGIITALYQKGARNFLILSIPDISKTPVFTNKNYPNFTEYSNAAAMHAGCAEWNQAVLMHSIQTMLSIYSDLKIYYFDVNPIFTNITSNPGKYGFKTSFPEIPNQQVCAGTCHNNQLAWIYAGLLETYGHQYTDPDDFIFFNYIHPTAHTHAILAQHLYDACFAGATPQAPCSLL